MSDGNPAGNFGSIYWLKCITKPSIYSYITTLYGRRGRGGGVHPALYTKMYVMSAILFPPPPCQKRAFIPRSTATQFTAVDGRVVRYHLKCARLRYVYRTRKPYHRTIRLRCAALAGWHQQANSKRHQMSLHPNLPSFRKCDVPFHVAILDSSSGDFL